LRHAWSEAHATPLCGPMGCAGVWVCGLKVNGLRERGAPGTRQWHQQMESPRESCCSVFCLPFAEHHHGHICRRLWTHRRRLPGFSWSAWPTVFPTETPSSRSSTACCHLHSYERIWKSAVPCAHTALTRSWGRTEVPCQEPGFAGSREFCSPSSHGCHDSAGPWGQTPLRLPRSQP